MDDQKLGGGTSAFWRCGDCGSRFLGPVALPLPGGHDRHLRDRSDPVRAAIAAERNLRRWTFPLLVLAVTILAVILILLLRDSGPLSLRPGVPQRP